MLNRFNCNKSYYLKFIYEYMKEKNLLKNYRKNRYIEFKAYIQFLGYCVVEVTDILVKMSKVDRNKDFVIFL